MPSSAFLALKVALKEVSDLRRADRSVVSTSAAALRLARALGRAQVVLLSSHFERYLYAVNEEAITYLNAKAVVAASLSADLKLLHSRQPIDELAETAWDRRSEKLTQFLSDDGWLWNTGLTGVLSHSRLLAWMKAPKPESLVRYYKYWGIKDVFTQVTRKPHTRNLLWLGVQELVDKRNNIAHGDVSAQATQIDIDRYASSVRTFCERADRLLARILARLTPGHAPW